MSENMPYQREDIDQARLGELKSEAMALHRVPDYEWLEYKACSNVDSDLFFQDDRLSTEQAKLYCAHCLVHLHCLRYALENGVEHGVWGGLSQSTLRRIRRLKIAEIPDVGDYAS